MSLIIFQCLKKPRWEHVLHYSEAVTQRCSVKKVFLEISQNSEENTCARVSFLIKKRLWHRYFPVNFAKFLRTPFLTEHLRWLFLIICQGKFMRMKQKWERIFRKVCNGFFVRCSVTNK